MKSLQYPLNVSVVAFGILFPSLMPCSYAAPYYYTTFAGIVSPAGTVSPAGALAIDSNDNLYVAHGVTGTQIISKISTNAIVTTIAGNRGYLFQKYFPDGQGTNASFELITGLAVDSKNNVYVADKYLNTIRKIDSNGMVTTLAGEAGISGSADGQGTNARFFWPTGVAVDSSDNLYVTDSSYATIRKIDSNGMVTTLAGEAGIYGTADGQGTNARFSAPQAIAIDSDTNLYVADGTSINAVKTIRKIDTKGMVTTLAGGRLGIKDGQGTNAGFGGIQGITLDSQGNLIVSDSGLIRKIDISNNVSTIEGGTNATFSDPQGIVTDSHDHLFIADAGASVIWMGSPPSPQTIAFPTIPNQTYSTNPFSITLPTSSSGLPVNVTLSPTNLAILTSDSLSMMGAGTVSLIATQPGNSQYLAATPVTNSFIISPSSQSVTFPTLTNMIFGRDPVMLFATDSAGLPITYSVLSGPATLSNNTLSFTGAGTITLVASAPATANYLAVSETNTYVLLESQTITFPTITNQTYNTNPFLITLPTSSSGLPVSVTLSPTNLVILTSNSLSMLGAGTVSLIATQPGNNKYQAATPVTNSFVIDPAPTPGTKLQAISFAQPSVHTYAPGVTFTLSASAPGGTVSFLSTDTNVISISGSTATINGAGTAKILAGQLGDSTYAPAKSVIKTVTVTKARNVIAFTQPPTQTFSGSSDVTFSLSASAPGGTVKFTSSNPKVITVSGNLATVKKVGRAKITAIQSGDANYKAATPVSHTVTVH